jgi:hypothetical protein
MTVTEVKANLHALLHDVENGDVREWSSQRYRQYEAATP